MECYAAQPQKPAP